VQVGEIVAGILMMLGAVTFGPRIAAKVWRDPAYAERMTRSGHVLPFGYATRRGMTRGVLPLWTGVGFIGAGTLAAATLPAGAGHPSSPALVVAGVCYALGLAAIGVNLCIVWFNRPRRLVPAYMRGEEGLATAWWRSRNILNGGSR
jgi:hypothetical protein